MKTILVSLLLSASAFAQATFPVQIPGEAAVSVSLSAQAVPSVNAFIAATSVGQPTTLTASALSTDTTFTLASALGLTTGMGVVIGSEASLITAINGNVITVTRHTMGTSAAAYSSSQAVSFIRSGDYSVFVANLIADTIRNVMVLYPGPTITTANATIATATATIGSTVAAGVTHVP